MSADPHPAGRGPSVLSALADAELAARAGGGDSGAFEALYRRHRDGLLRYCTGILRHAHDAEEALQATMLSAHRALAGGRRPSAVRAWLAAIARNECRDLLRARPSVDPLAADVPDRSEAPEEGLARRQRLRALRDDLGALPGRQRAALMLTGVAGLPHAEAAELIGASPGETRSLVHEARESLSEFEAGRDLRCADVRERFEACDGRALRARRIGAHLRACAACREHLERTRVRRRRRGLGALLPPLSPAPLVEALRGLLGAGRAALGGSPAGLAGGAGAGAAALASALVLVGGVPVGGGPDAGGAGSGPPARATPAALQVTAAPSGAGPATRPGHRAGRAPAGQAPSPAVPPAARAAPAAAPAGGTTAPAAASGGPSAGLGDVSAAPLIVPRVTAPSVSVASGSVLPVRVPSVTVPPISLQPPAAPFLPPLPAVQTPAVTTPVVEPPPLPLPLPEVSLPEVPLPGIQIGAPEGGP